MYSVSISLLTEALSGEEGEHWKEAIQAELDQLKEMGTWRLEDLPPGREPIGCKWVFLQKKDEKGNIIKYKA
jgi:hypothetical protein